MRWCMLESLLPQRFYFHVLNSLREQYAQTITIFNVIITGDFK